jgi:hypothetical protein
MEAMKRATICCRVPNSQAANAAQHFKPPRITVLDESKAYDDLEFQSGPFTVDAEGSYNWADCIGETDFRAAPVSCFKHVSDSQSHLTKKLIVTGLDMKYFVLSNLNIYILLRTSE